MSTLAVTIVQQDIVWHDSKANLALLSRELDALESPVDLIVLPEMFTTGFSMDAETLAESIDGPSVNWLRARALETGAAICGSLIIRDAGRYYNRFIFMRPDGTYESYDKRHLFRLAREHRHYSSGNKRVVFEYRGFRICPQVCYDLRFPVWSRSLDDYDLLIYVANWPAARHLAWRTLIRARAIENQAYAVAVNRAGTDGNEIAYLGGSAVVDFLGQDLCELDTCRGTATVTLEKEPLQQFRKRYPFHDDADPFQLVTASGRNRDP